MNTQPTTKRQRNGKGFVSAINELKEANKNLEASLNKAEEITNEPAPAKHENLSFAQKLKLAAELEAQKKAENAEKKALEVLAQTPAPFIGPEHSFNFQAQRTLENGETRNYLITVSKSGNMVAYIWGNDGKPVLQNGLPLILKRKLVNSIPMVVEKLSLNQDSVVKLENKEYRAKELNYLESVQLPDLKTLLAKNLTDLQVSNLVELSEAFKRVNARNSAIFSAHIRGIIKTK